MSNAFRRSQTDLSGKNPIKPTRDVVTNIILNLFIESKTCAI